MSAKSGNVNITVKATNRKALRDYEIESRLEAGIALLGSEIKSIRDGRVNIRDAYAAVEGGEAYLYGMHISPYPQAAHFGHEPERKRKLLLHRDEIKTIAGKIQEKGYTLVPLRVYIKNGWAKIELGLARGKRKHDKRREIARREAQREMERAARRKR